MGRAVAAHSALDRRLPGAACAPFNSAEVTRSQRCPPMTLLKQCETECCWCSFEPRGDRHKSS